MSDYSAQTPVSRSNDIPPISTTSAHETSGSNPPPVTSNDPITTSDPIITTPKTTPPTSSPPTTPTTTPVTRPDTTSSPTIITTDSATYSNRPPPISRTPTYRPSPSPSSTWTSIPTPVIIVTRSGDSVYTFTSTSYSSKIIMVPSSNLDTPTNQINAGEIAGGVVGGVAGLAVIGLGIFFFLRRRTKKRQHHLSYSTSGAGGFGSVADGLENKSHHPDDFYGTATAATGNGGGGYSEMGDSSTSTKARPFVAPLGGHQHQPLGGSSDDGNSAGYYSPTQRPQQQDYYQDHDFYATPYQYVTNHPMQYPHQNQSGSTQPSSTERHIPHLVQEHDGGPSYSIDVPHSKDE